MNGRTGTVKAGLAPGLPRGMPLAAPARPAPARRKPWPGTRPWPLFSALGPIGALPTAPGLAREFTAMVIGGWDLTGVNDVAQVSLLVASELATNVVKAATDRDGNPLYQGDGRLTELWLRLMSDRAQLQVEVWDNLPASAGVPVICHPDAEEENGRGLAIIARLSQCWGWDQIPGTQAKSVWALLQVC
jgi:anti-sigma regulatory factor (Ser/Thr protein kinase)